MSGGAHWVHQLDPCGKLCWLLSSSCLHRAHVLRFSTPDIGRRARASCGREFAKPTSSTKSVERFPPRKYRGTAVHPESTFPRAPSSTPEPWRRRTRSRRPARWRRARSSRSFALRCRAPRVRLARRLSCPARSSVRRMRGKKCLPLAAGAPARRDARPTLSIVAPRAFRATRDDDAPPVNPPPRTPPRGAVPPPRPRSSTPCPPRAPRCPGPSTCVGSSVASTTPSVPSSPSPSPRASLRLKSGQGARGDLGVRLPHRASRPVHLRRRRRGISDPERRCVPRTRPRWRFPEPPRRRPAPRRRSPKPRERSKRSPGRRSPAPLPRTRIS